MPLTKSEQRAKAFEEFRTGFKRSRKKNLWRHFCDLTLTIFARAGRKGYGWVIVSGESRDFSTEKFESEDEAVEHLWDEIHQWYVR